MTLFKTFIITLLFTLFTSAAMADTIGTGTGNSGGTSGGENSNFALTTLNNNHTCGNDVIDPNSKEIKIFSVGVKCFETITAGLAENNIQRFSASLAHIVYIVLVLYIIFFGVKVSSGLSAGGRLKGEAFAGALKIAFVGFLVFGFSGSGFNIGLAFGSFGANLSAISGLSAANQPGLIQIYALVIASYHSLITIVLPQNGFGGCSGGGSSITFLSAGTDAVWQSMDCMFSKFIGWNAKNGYGGGSGASSYGGVALLFGYITSKILPANGFFIGGILFSTLFGLLMGFFRLAFIYILSMIALILLFSIGPLIIPLMLFKRTEQFFEGWYRLILGVILQPLILFAFFAFIGGLLTNTIAQLEQLFKDMKPSYETSGVTRTGDTQQVDTAFVMQSASNAIDKMDKEMLLNGVVILVIAYLLVSFIKFVGEMASELSGAQSLNLQKFAPKFAGGRGGE